MIGAILIGGVWALVLWFLASQALTGYELHVCVLQPRTRAIYGAVAFVAGLALWAAFVLQPGRGKRGAAPTPPAALAFVAMVSGLERAPGSEAPPLGSGSTAGGGRREGRAGGSRRSVDTRRIEVATPRSIFLRAGGAA